MKLAPRMLDYAVMSGAYVWYDAAANRAEHTNAFRFLQDNALIFGWTNDLGEHDTVASASWLNACLIPADWACNLSVLSGFRIEASGRKRLFLPRKADAPSAC